MHLSEIITQVLRVAPLADRAQVDVMLNLIQRQFIQPYARLSGTAEYEVITQDEKVLLADISADIYKLNYVLDITDGVGDYVVLPLLGPEEINTNGIRIEDDAIHMQGLVSGTDLELHYEKRLTPLGGGTDKVEVPEIPEDWHDLYWLGTAWMFGNQNMGALFMDRLNAFGQSRRDAVTQPGFRIRKKW